MVLYYSRASSPFSTNQTKKSKPLFPEEISYAFLLFTNSVLIWKNVGECHSLLLTDLLEWLSLKLKNFALRNDTVKKFTYQLKYLK